MPGTPAPDAVASADGVSAALSPEPATRPRLVPRARWAQVTLVLLVLFVLLRGMTVASTQPGWVAPDEDYHWNYTEYLLTQHRIPQLDKPFATGELFRAVAAIGQNAYIDSARSSYKGDPKRIVGFLESDARKERGPTGEPPRPVLHPPLYYAGPLLIDRLVQYKAAPTRLTLMRYWSSVIGAFGVYAAWLLAAQVLARESLQLTAASLVGLQPMANFANGVLGNDALALATFTLALAWMAFLLRTRPSGRQGIGLGLVLLLAVYAKASSLALLPIAALALALLWKAWPDRRREIRRIALWAGGLLLVVAGPWYAYLVGVTGSILGAKGDVASLLHTPLITHPGGGSLGTLLPASAGLPPLQSIQAWFEWNWETYWLFQFLDQVPASPWTFVPLLLAIPALVGLVVRLVPQRRSLFDPERPVLRQAVVLVSAPLLITLPFFLLDMARIGADKPFIVVSGRLQRPALAAFAVLTVLGLCLLADRFAPRLLRFVPVGTVAVAFAFYCHVFWTFGIARNYGSAGFGESLRRASFDKPEWVTQGSLTVVTVVSGLAFAGILALLARTTLSRPPAPAA